MTTAVPAEAREAAPDSAAPMTHRQIMEALSGLLLGLFVAILSSTVVSNALPTIITDLHAGETTYTWVITATLLALTVSTPIWGKLSDLVSKKLLVQLGLIIYVLGSVFAGFAQNPAMLISARVVQGLGVGGLTALVQVIMAAMISPRERGRYSGYLGAVFALATVAGPLIGGVIVDTDWLGWRWCFYVGVPFAIIALIVLQKTLKLPVAKRKVKIDWSGAVLISAAASLLLIWISFAGSKFDWLSWQTGAMVGGSVVLALLFILVETRAREPIVPLHLFRNRAISLAVVASLFVGVGMYGVTTFLSQYFQLARGETPTMAGVMTLPMIVGLALSSAVVGQIISRTGRWKIFLIIGGVSLTVGLALMGMLRADTDYWLTGVYMFLIGAGVGMTMQNLVLSVQNQVQPQELGAASSVVTFFRTLGGTAGVAALGALLANRVAEYTGGGGSGDGSIPKLSTLPPKVRAIVEAAFGHAVGDVFLYAAPLALIALIVILFIKEVPLRTSNTDPIPTRPIDSRSIDSRSIDSDPSPAGGDRPGRHARELEELAALSAGARNGSNGSPSAFRGFGDVQTQPQVAARVETMAHASAGTTGGQYGSGIYGYIRGSDGTPVGHATLTMIDPRGHQLGRAVTQPNGAYSLRTPGSGTYVVIASATEYDPQVATLVVGEQPLEFDLILAGSGKLTGTVRDTDGRAVAQAMVIVTDVRGEVVSTGATLDDGTFGFDGVVAGTYTLAVSAGTYRPTALQIEVGTGQTTQDIVLQAGTRLRGTVRVQDGGRPLADARVTLLDTAGNVVGTAMTGDDGEYAFADLTSGQYTVIATGYPPVATALNLTGQGEDGHDLWLGHSG
jgi:EmrB/QacA subfamily drug resistance transporter